MICNHHLLIETTQQMATIINETAIKTMVRMILGVLATEDVSIEMDNSNFIDLTIEFDLVKAWLDVSFDEWSLGCCRTYRYLLENRDVLANFANILLSTPGTSVDETLCSKLMLLVFEVIYYYRLGPGVFPSLLAILDTVLLPRIQKIAPQVATRMPLVWEV